MKTAKYRKRCFDQIEGITANNKELAAEVEHLRHQLEAADQEKMELEAQKQNLGVQLINKEQEKTSKLLLHHSKCMIRVFALLIVTTVVQAWKPK